jgi:hypothetical protein
MRCRPMLYRTSVVARHILIYVKAERITVVQLLRLAEVVALLEGGYEESVFGAPWRLCISSIE